MAIFSCKFGNAIVSSNGEEIETTVPNCTSCRVCCPYEYFDGCVGKKPIAEKCKYFIPKNDHIFYKGQWWS